MATLYIHIRESKQSLADKPQTAPIVEELQDNVEGPQHTPIVAEVHEIAQEKTLDNFIKGLPNAHS